MARLIYRRSAARVLQRMDRRTRQRIAEALDKLEKDPDRQDLDITPIAGTGGFRLRIGGWRVLYDREPVENETEEEIVIQAIRPRGQAYRR